MMKKIHRIHSIAELRQTLNRSGNCAKDNKGKAKGVTSDYSRRMIYTGESKTVSLRKWN